MAKHNSHNSPEVLAALRTVKRLDEAFESEVSTPVGFIDILTQTKLIEVKHFRDWKSALGQVLAYGYYYPDREKIIALFAPVQSTEKRDIVAHVCSTLGVSVWLV